MRHLLFICLLLFCVACEENESVDPTIMPEATTSVTVSAQVGLGSYIRFTIADPKEGETLPYVNLSFENQNMEDGKVYISRMSDGVFSGTFEGGRITEGRFDLKYTDRGSVLHAYISTVAFDETFDFIQVDQM